MVPDGGFVFVVLPLVLVSLVLVLLELELVSLLLSLVPSIVYIKFEFVFDVFALSHLKFNVPVAASSPKTYKSIPTINDININGTNTMIQEITVIPP